MRTVLVASDRTEASAGVVTWASHLARRLGGRLAVVTAYAGADGGGAAPGQRQRIEAQLDALVDSAVPKDLAVDRRVVIGDPREVVPDTVAAVDADLVVLGARVHSGVAGSRFGSVTNHLVHTLRCPTIVTARALDPDRPLHRFLVGVDGSGANEVALDWATSLGGVLGVEVVAVHAHHDLVGPEDVPWRTPVRTGRAHDESVAAVDARADRISRFLEVDGDPAEVLAAEARTRDADVVVVGTRGLGSLRGRVLGRTPTRLLEDPELTVAIVPHG